MKIAFLGRGETPPEAVEKPSGFFRQKGCGLLRAGGKLCEAFLTHWGGVRTPRRFFAVRCAVGGVIWLRYGRRNIV